MTSTARSYFEDMYDGDSDPWGFATSDYERRKYGLTLASLPYAHYGAVFEPGCSIGVLTERLAPRCDRLVATDIIPSALEQARARLHRYSHVNVTALAIPAGWPDEQFDLVVLSEIAYYFDQSDLGHIVSLVLAATPPGAHLIGVHWRGRTDYPLSGDQAHAVIGATPGLAAVVSHLEDEFVLQVWERTR
jgi:SAM-dependent methyltransferase